MAAGAPPILRTPMILLALAGLAAITVRLWPWRQIANLPGNGTAAYDPALLLLAYLGLVPWISSGITDSTRKALSGGAIIGIAAGGLLAGDVLLGVWQTPQQWLVEPALLGVAAILWGVAGLRGSKIGGRAAMGAFTGLWSAILSSLMAASAALARLYVAVPLRESPDPWKQYEGLAIGNPAMQALVHALNTATAFLLFGPIAGAAFGLVFAFFAQDAEG
jgi:hypothetical protein